MTTVPEEAVKAMPDRIYAVRKTEGSNCVVSFDTPSLDYNVEYVRADLVSRDSIIQELIDQAPLSLRLLGEMLSARLDDDQWNNAEPLLVSISAALSAALPHLPGVGVKKLEWQQDGAGNHRAETPFGNEFVQKWTDSRDGNISYEHEGAYFENVEDAKAAAQADYAARILSALEPSAARGLGLVSEEAVIALSNYMQADEDGIMVLVSRQAIEECLPTLRALSSPDHADAGKVEGDEWLPMTHPDLPLNGASVVMFDSFIPGKDGFGQVIARFDKTHGWHVSASVVGGKYIQLTNPTKWRPLFSAPSLEVAG
ncbi:hypothetical protein [Brucella intermedia]|uniref:hypothetical protein n=1 Tax=Brucella intermedia TaxID=94625 RepID=UPI00235FB854|nr:hypothetical protein [Brucella intermedia]